MRTITRRTALRRKSIFWCFCCLEKYTKGKETRAGIQCGISRKTKSLEHAGVTDNVYIFSRPLGWTEPGPNGSVYSILDSSLLMSLFLALPAAPAREAVWYTRQSLVVLRSSADQSRPEQSRPGPTGKGSIQRQERRFRGCPLRPSVVGRTWAATGWQCRATGPQVVLSIVQNVQQPPERLLLLAPKG
jgi:hypothetical protein